MLRRMISAGILVTVGAVASAAAVHARCPEALKAVGAALTALGSLAGNVFATDLHNALTRRSRSPRDEAVNHDILRAIGRAIAMLLESAAQDAEPTGADNRLRRALALGADDTRALRSMAKAVPAWWVGWATVSADSPPEAAPDDADVREKIAAMARADTAGSGGACEIPGVTLAPEAFWKSALDALAVQASVKPTEDLLERVAKRLETELPWYLREVLKEDAVAGGKAYPALMLDMMGSILGSVSEIMTGLNALSDDERQRHAEVMRALDALAQNARDQGRTLAARLDESQYAQLKEQWDKIDAQYDSIVKELKDLGEKVDNVGEKLEDIGEKFESLQATLVAKGDAPIGPPPVAPIPEPGALAVYEPRDAEKDAVAAAMFRADGSFGVGALVGMAGVGKTYLAELIAWERRDRLPGGMLRLELEPGSDAREDELAAELCARYGVTVSGGMDPALALRARLACPLSMLLIENVDAHEQVAPVSALIKALPGIPALITGRCVTLRNVRGWTVRELEPFDRKQSDSLLDREMGAHASRLSEEDRRRLFDDLGGVPLAIGIAASHIRRIGGSASAFLDDFHRSKAGIAHAPGSDQERNLRAAIEVSVGALKAAEGQDAVAGLARMAFGPAAGMGADLARTASGLDNDSFRDCCASASELSLLRLREGDSGIEHVGFHPLVAEVLRDHGDESAALEAMTDWFVQHLPEGVDDQGERWGRIQAELPALERWLGAVPEGRLREAGRAGSRYAIFNGPYRWWAPLCERLIASGAAADRSIARWTLGTLQYRAGDLDGALATAQAMRREDAERGAERDAAFAAGLIAGILFSRGDLDEALRIRREEELPVYERLGDVRSRAVTMGRIADILFSRGDLDEALRIRREEELPVYERLGDVHSRAVTMAEIADILRSRGDLDEALRILREDALPVYERLGDVHSRAVTMGRIADILQSRGDLDEALRILREDALPAFERLGDVRSRAVTMGKIADILRSRGDLDEALRICREEELPAFERLGDVRSRAVTMGRIADILFSRGDLDEALRIRREEELPVYERLGAVRERAVTMGRIADILRSRGDLDEALRIRRDEELPVYERLGDVHSRAVTMGKIADILRSQGDLDEALRILREEELPVYERLGDVHSRAVTMAEIADILQSRGDLDEALRILREDALPAFERLGAVRSRAGTMGRIADILQSRGDLDEALRILREEALPVYERLGDVRSRAVTMGRIADILFSRGDLDEALRIRREEELPVYERLGDMRERAVTMGKIADILFSRGDLDEALRIRREEELPVYERLGDVRSRALTMGKIADILQSRGDLDEALRILREDALPAFERLGAVRERALTMGRIADILRSRGDLDEALRILREEALPVYERLGDVHSRAVTMGRIADILFSRGDLDEALRILREEALPVYERLGDVRALLEGRVYLAFILKQRGKPEDGPEIERLMRQALADARRLRIPEAEQIQGFMREMGIAP